MLGGETIMVLACSVMPLFCTTCVVSEAHEVLVPEYNVTVNGWVPPDQVIKSPWDEPAVMAELAGEIVTDKRDPIFDKGEVTVLGVLSVTVAQ